MLISFFPNVLVKGSPPGRRRESALHNDPPGNAANVCRSLGGNCMTRVAFGSQGMKALCLVLAIPVVLSLSSTKAWSQG